MPRSRPQLDRTEKRDEIVGAATKLFLEGGFDATPLSVIARAAGVTANTIYWYFEDKDALLLATMNAVLRAEREGLRGLADRPLAEQLTWIAARIRQLGPLVTAIHARVPASPAVNEWHEAFHSRTEGMLAREIRRSGSPVEDVRSEVQIAMFALEGLTTHRLAADEQARICAALAARWTAATSSPTTA